MSIYIIFVISVLGFSLVTIYLHRISPRIGFTPLMFFLASLVAMLGLSTPLVIFLEPSDKIILRIPPDVFVPVILMIVLTLYVANGTRSAQQAIYGVAMVNLLSLATLIAIGVFASLPTATATNNEQLLTYTPNYREFLVASLVFIFDMLIIAVVYQGIKNAFPMVSKWILPGLALLIALWVDAVLFYLLGSFGTERFLTLLPGNIINKTVAGVIISVPLTIYLFRYACNMPEFADNADRPTLDVMHDSVTYLRRALNQSQTQLYENQINFQQLTNNMNEVFWLADIKDRRIYYVSASFENLTGIDRAVFYETPELLCQLIHKEDRASVRHNLMTHNAYEEEFRIVRENGDVRWIQNRAFLIEGNEDYRQRIAGIAQDITGRKEAHEQNIKLTIEQERIRILHNFISDASHDLKTPISVIKLKTALIARAKDDEARNRHLTTLENQVDRLATMIDNLFTLSRLENTQDWQTEPTNINTLIQELQHELTLKAQEKSIELTLDLERQQMPDIHIDRGEFSRAIGNLVGNSIRYTFNGGQVTVQTRYQFGDVFIRISDTGIGINEEELPHIFDRFYRAKTATHHKIEGSGLGLSIVKRIIERHHGEISVTSKPGAGTTFTIKMPPVS